MTIDQHHCTSLSTNDNLTDHEKSRIGFIRFHGRSIYFDDFCFSMLQPAWIAGSGFHQVAKLETCRSCQRLTSSVVNGPTVGKKAEKNRKALEAPVGRVEMR
jgi:hypothetical protein